MKFRVYEKKQKKYVTYGDVWIIKSNGELGVISEKIEINPEDYIVEFSTGVQDKNGVDIYEGDIVETIFGRLCGVVWHKSQSYNCWDLVPVNTPENMRLHTPTDFDLWASHNLEVVGHIHEEKVKYELVK